MEPYEVSEEVKLLLTPDNRPSLAELLQDHIDHCQTCLEASRLPPRKLGMISRMCAAYQRLAQAWADSEGGIVNPNGNPRGNR